MVLLLYDLLVGQTLFLYGIEYFEVKNLNRPKALSAPEFSSWLEDNIEEDLTCFNFPRNHQIKIRTSNELERVNREIKRRTRVAVLFPNAESALRLVTGVLIEIHEDWITDKIYLKMTDNKEEKYSEAI